MASAQSPRQTMNQKRWVVVGVAAVLGVIAFLLFRPDTLFTEVRADETLANAFTSETTAPPTTDAVITPSTTESEGEPAVTIEPTSPPESGAPQALSSGGFLGIDHSAEGTATIYEQDGRYVLRFEDDTNIQNGPDLYVWLLPTETYEGGDPQEFTDLGTLKGTTGGQNYECPPTSTRKAHGRSSCGAFASPSRSPRRSWRSPVYSSSMRSATESTMRVG